MIVDLNKQAFIQGPAITMLIISRKYTLSGKKAGLYRLIFLFAFILFNSSLCLAQKYTFSHYDIEDGLIQSQVNKVSLDTQHRLWMATDGGACRFDGQDYTSYTRQNGMPTNFVFTVLADRNGRTWFGTQSGLVELVNKNLVSFPTPAKLRSKMVTSIVQDDNGSIWFIQSNHLFRVFGRVIKEQAIQDTIKGDFTYLAVNKKGELFASLYQKGIYQLQNGKWINVVSFPKKDIIVNKILFDRQDMHKLYLLTYNAIYTVKNGMMENYEGNLIASVKSAMLSLEQDTASNLWIGTVNGAYYLEKQQITHFTSNNGFTDNPVTDIYNDADNNLWLASQGSGLFKYEGDRFLTFDRSHGLPDNEIIMSIAKEKTGQIILGISGGGLMRYDGKKLLPVAIPAKYPELNRVQSIYTDKKGVLWIGTERNGVWNYDNNTFRKISKDGIYSVNDIREDEQGTIWAAGPAGCFYIENNICKRLDNFYSFATTILPIGKDSVIIGTGDGILLAVNKKIVRNFELKAVRTSAIYCMLRYKNRLMIGTDDRGLFGWDMASGAVKNYSLKDGLNSNTIYSLVADINGVIWAGTGRGVNRVLFDAKNNRFNIMGSGGSKHPILESNQNAAFYADHKVWIGTTKGVIAYDIDDVPTDPTAPHIVIESVKLIPQTSGNEAQSNTVLTDGANLPYNQNHLAISFLGVYLKDPENVSYRYKLKGLDTSYSSPVKNNMVDYPSLPPGKYTFEVKALAPNGMLSSASASFSFSITPPFYQTIPFRVLAITFFVLLGIILQSYRHNIRIKRQQVIEATKREESLRIRQQTAEDFHDELGNKLTRITVLSEILDTKMDQTQADQKKLLEQIKQNASSLYNGTKDILWALDPQSDNLYEILNHIKDFGKELFLDTPVEFEFNGIDESLNQVKLPMEYSRNIPMIFKELLNNILKHAHARHVVLNLDYIERDEMHLTLKDNGAGFEQHETRKGQGINNVVMRIKRINGEIGINSAKDKGTLIDLKIKINPVITH